MRDADQMTSSGQTFDDPGDLDEEGVGAIRAERVRDEDEDEDKDRA